MGTCGPEAGSSEESSPEAGSSIAPEAGLFDAEAGPSGWMARFEKRREVVRCQRLGFGVGCWVFGVWGLGVGVWFLVFGGRCFVFGFGCLVFGVGVWGWVFGVGCLVLGV